MKLLHEVITDQIIKAYYKVYNTLGYGFLERVYENALLQELTETGIACVKQMPIEVFYEGVKVGLYFADLVVEQKVIVEIKAGECLHPAHEAQLLNYLKATDKEVGLLLNFGEKPEFRRKIMTNDRK